MSEAEQKKKVHKERSASKRKEKNPAKDLDESADPLAAVCPPDTEKKAPSSKPRKTRTKEVPSEPAGDGSVPPEKPRKTKEGKSKRDKDADPVAAPATASPAAPAKKSSKAVKPLPTDPTNSANVWCEVCRKSLAKSREVSHLETAEHKRNAAKVLEAIISLQRESGAGHHGSA